MDFTANEASREYRLRVRRGTDVHHFTVAIPNEAFLAGRVRYQDAPDICFLKLQKELAADEEGGLPDAGAQHERPGARGVQGLAHPEEQPPTLTDPFRAPRRTPAR